MKREVNVNNKLLITLTILVALVFIFQVFGANLTGEAVFSRQREPTVTHSSVLNMISNCKSVSPFQQRGSGGIFLAEGLTPNQYCKKIGYDSCLLVNNEFYEMAWNSEDSSCSGLNYIELRNEVNSPVDCNTFLTKEFSGDNPSGCLNAQNDYITNRIIRNIICCSIPKN